MYGDAVYPQIRSLTNDKFEETLKLICLLYQFFNNDESKKDIINKTIKDVFSHSTIDLGIKWSKGMFYPSGAEELDEKLIEETYDWLTEFPNEKKDFQNAILNYTNKKYDDVIGNCYNAIEGLARHILGNKKVLDNNIEDLLRKLDLSQEWKSLLKNFIAYANEFKRHASEKRHKVNPSEVEAYLYFTGVLIRLIIQSK